MAMFATSNSFNAGELSPKMLGRMDVSQYGKGCQKLENFLVTPYGAVERRPGTIFMAETKTTTGKVRLIPFIFSSTIAYICEFGDKYIRFYYDHEFVVEIVSPYESDDLEGLKFIQSADVMFIVHPDYPVHELKRKTATTFTIKEMEFKYPPVLDPNLNNDINIKPSALEGDITLEVELPVDYDDDDIFTADNVGGYWQLVHTRRENDISKDFKENGHSDSLEVFGYWSFTTHGTWGGTVKIQRSFDDGTTWNDFRTYTSANDNNISTSGEEETDGVLYRVRMEDYVQSGSGTIRLCRAKLSNPDFVVNGEVKITAVTDSTHASATVIRKLGSLEKTHEWNEGAFSVRRGFARTIAFYEERLMFGGTEYKPQTVWGSKTNDWNDFLLGSNDDQGLEFTLASDTVNNIAWMSQHDALVMGAGDSEWTLSASTADAPLTASNVKVKRQSVYGSSNISAKMVGDVILFVQRQGRKVREFVYTWEKDGYVSPDLTILADHITESGIKEIALQQQPDNILWCSLNNGNLAAMTYERDQEIVGWHKHTTDGTFESIAVIPENKEDFVYAVVKRGDKRMIERFSSRSWSGVENSCYVDSAVTMSGTPEEPIETITGLNHLEGKTVAVLADGSVQPSKVVTAGQITLEEPAQVVWVGLPYTSLLSPMPIELELQNGLSLLRKKNIGELRIRVYDSVGGMVRAGDDDFQEIISREILGDSVNAPITPKHEVVQVQVRSGYSETTKIEIKQDEPLPLNVAVVESIYQVTE